MQGPKRRHLGYNWDGHWMGTPGEGLRGQRVINSSCQGLATVTLELFCTEQNGESDPPPPHLGEAMTPTVTR